MEETTAAQLLRNLYRLSSTKETKKVFRKRVNETLIDYENLLKEFDEIDKK